MFSRKPSAISLVWRVKIVNNDFYQKLRWGNGDRCSLSFKKDMAIPRYQLVYKVRHALRKQGQLLRIPRSASNQHGIHIVDEQSMRMVASHVSLDDLARSLGIADGK